MLFPGLFYWCSKYAKCIHDYRDKDAKDTIIVAMHDVSAVGSRQVRTYAYVDISCI